MTKGFILRPAGQVIFFDFSIFSLLKSSAGIVDSLPGHFNLTLFFIPSFFRVPFRVKGG
jgi:hypothetical protein